MQLAHGALLFSQLGIQDKAGEQASRCYRKLYEVDKNSLQQRMLPQRPRMQRLLLSLRLLLKLRRSHSMLQAPPGQLLTQCWLYWLHLRGQLRCRSAQKRSIQLATASYVYTLSPWEKMMNTKLHVKT